MAQANPFDQFDSAQPAQPAPRPQSPPPFIQGTISPTKQAAETRAQQDQALQMERFRLDQEKAARDAEKDQRTAQKDASGTVDEKKIATLTTRLAGAFSDMAPIIKNDPSAAEPGIIESVRGGLSNDGITAIPARAIAGANRRSVYDAEIDALDALLTLGTGAAYNREQLDGQRIAYFPAYGDTAEERALKKNRLARLIEAAKVNAGPAWQQVEPQIAQFMQTQEDRPDPIATTFGGDGSKPNPGNNPDGYVEIDPVTGEETVVGWTQEQKDRYNRLIEMNANYGRATGNLGTDGRFDAGNAYGQRFKEGIMVGLGDEVSGVGGFIGAGIRGENPMQGYLDARDAARIRQIQMRDQQGFAGTVAEFGGGMIPAMLMPGATAGTVAGAARAGGAFGATTGFGEGRGFQESARNALIGGVIGAGTGAVTQKGLEMAPRAVTTMRDFVANRRMGGLIGNADEVARAAEAEGITANNAMLRSGQENRVTGVDASLAGGKRIQEGMRSVEGQVESRVADLGQGGTPMNKVTQGQTIQDAGERFIKDSGKQAGIKYDRAEKMAGGAKVAPGKSIQVIDDAIAKLSETPGVNAAEIRFLETLKDDLSKDLSVGGLRRIRTSLRKKISRGELVFGEDEATVLGVMQAASDDIYNGLSQQGKQAAADAFLDADRAYAQRMDYISGTLQKIIGKRGANLPAERVAENLNAMARGKDEAGVREFFKNLTKDERADMAATFADALGKNNKGEFSISHFLTQTSEKNMPAGVLKVVFGDEGAASIGRLRTVSKEVERVTSAMNSRTSKSAIPGDYRSWLFNILVGAGGVGLQSPKIIAAAVAAGGIKAGRDVLSARALLSSDISKWLLRAPRTTNPQAINRHFAELTQIASRGGAARMDAQQIADFLQANVANPSTTAAAAKDDEQN